MSEKVRVYELAKETGLHNKEVMRRLSDLGIDVRSHSSSVAPTDAARFRESLGKSDAERRAEAEAKRKREQEELERYRSMQAAAPPERKKAAKVLPPHLREQQAKAEAAQAAAAPAPAEPTVPEEEVAPAPAPQAEPEAPATSEPTAPAARDTGGDTDGAAAAGATKRMPGAPPPRLKPGEAPLRPPSTRGPKPP
ncbi:MAG: translation initiation factor IF-2 N-terminal domain-containing protein, partial [Nitriliruptoraceae bacterium]